MTIRILGNAIVDRVSLDIEPGTAHVIAGRNGAGKSTLIQAMLGRIAFEGRIVMHWRRDGSIGFVPQSFGVDPTLPVTVRDFLALTRTRRPVSLGVSASMAARIDRLLARVGMQGKAGRPLAGLSGGELRRVLLAHALDPEPELLILDEPGTGLDEESARWLDDTLVSLRQARRTTVLMVSHDQDRVRRLADTVTLLDTHVVRQGTPDDVFGTDVSIAAAGDARR
ncbi:MAG: metal ABC transporter ATP-binding protein [Vicinamibacterales bacterium]